MADIEQIASDLADVEIALLGGVVVTKSQAKLALPALVPAKGSIVVLTVKDIADSPDVAAYESGDTVISEDEGAFRLSPVPAGRVTVDGRDAAAESTREQVRMALVFQSGALFNSLSVYDNLALYPREHEVADEAAIREKVMRALQILSLEGTASKAPSELSGGMKKRAGLARALALDPELLFLDEPTAGLDPIGAAKFDELLRELADTLGLTVFLITHDLDTLYEICDRVAVLADKRVIAVGTIPELLESDHPWIQEYFNGPRGRAASTAKDRAKAMDKQAGRGA